MRWNDGFERPRPDSAGLHKYAYRLTKKESLQTMDSGSVGVEGVNDSRRPFLQEAESPSLGSGRDASDSIPVYAVG